MFFKAVLENKLGKEIRHIHPLSGGDINEVFLIETAGKKYVLKLNRENTFPEMFTKEKSGLELLLNSGVRSPKVIACFTHSEYQYLLLEYLESTPKKNTFWKNFARDLARLHHTIHNSFGLDHDNYIGSLKQLNTPKDSWTIFYIENRLTPLIEKAYNKNLLNKAHLTGFENLFSQINGIITKEKPSLLHGDLWSGNLMCSTDQTPCFIDPAVYYGHREMDIAMTQMFGGFDNSYLEHYNEFFPLENGWKERIKIHNLYPNLVHLNLFGRSYLSGIENVIRRF